jgi:hypothetical protein
MRARPRSISVAWVFVGLNALVWLAFGLIVALDLHPSLPDQPLVKGVLAVLALGCAGALLGVLVFLIKRSRAAYFMATGLLAVTATLFAFDDFGLTDFVVLVINLVPLVLLIRDRAWYLSNGLR